MRLHVDARCGRTRHGGDASHGGIEQGALGIIGHPARLREEVRRLREDREILKKAAAVSSRRR
jgi:hypothetical protein